MEQKEFVYDPKVPALANIAHLAATKPCSILEAQEILEREQGIKRLDKEGLKLAALMRDLLLTGDGTKRYVAYGLTGVPKSNR